MPTVFLSYRWSDTGAEAGRLADTFQQKLGGGLTFRDVSSIPVGEQFPWLLQGELAAAAIMLVLIGPDWLAELHRRLAQSDVDYVRLEISIALATRKRIILVLLKGAAPPKVQDLPLMGYLALERARFDGKLNIDCQIDDEARKALVPGIILQPLVEKCR